MQCDTIFFCAQERTKISHCTVDTSLAIWLLIDASLFLKKGNFSTSSQMAKNYNVHCGQDSYTYDTSSKAKLVAFSCKVFSGLCGIVGDKNDSFAHLAEFVDHFWRPCNGFIAMPQNAIAVGQNCVKRIEKSAGFLRGKLACIQKSHP